MGQFSCARAHSSNSDTTVGALTSNTNACNTIQNKFVHPLNTGVLLLTKEGMHVAANAARLILMLTRRSPLALGFHASRHANRPLDLRFDTSHGESAWDYLQTCTREHLIQVIVDYGGENPNVARRIADAIMLTREGLWGSGGLPTRSQEFARLVAAAKGKEYQAMHPAKMTFQALRIHVNREFDELKRGMRSALKVMKDGGKLGIITWKHSECAIVVDQSRRLEVARQDYPLLTWYNSAQKAAKAGDTSLLPQYLRPKDAGDGGNGAAATVSTAGGVRTVFAESTGDDGDSDGDSADEDGKAAPVSDGSTEPVTGKKRRLSAKEKREQKRQKKNATKAAEGEVVNTPGGDGGVSNTGKHKKLPKSLTDRKLPKSWGFVLEDISRSVLKSGNPFFYQESARRLRCGGLLLSLSADVRSTDDVIAFV